MKDKVKRNFIPGEEWVCFKLYMGELMCNHFISNDLSNIVTELNNNNLLEIWFFIRYNDPKFHLRLRLKLFDKTYFFKALQIVTNQLQKYLKNDLIWEIQINSYKRELERYGFNSINNAEILFHQNSVFVLELLEKHNSNPLKDELFWKYTLKYMDTTLTTFGYSILDKINITKKIIESFEQEFSFHNNQQYIVNDKYRKYRTEIENLFESINIIQQQKYVDNYLSLHIKETKDYCSKLDVKKYIPAAGIIHMHCNRLFELEPRKIEFIIYSFLLRFYNSIIKKDYYQNGKN